MRQGKVSEAENAVSPLMTADELSPRRSPASAPSSTTRRPRRRRRPSGRRG